MLSELYELLNEYIVWFVKRFCHILAVAWRPLKIFLHKILGFGYCQEIPMDCQRYFSGCWNKLKRGRAEGFSFWKKIDSRISSKFLKTKNTVLLISHFLFVANKKKTYAAKHNISWKWFVMSHFCIRNFFEIEPNFLFMISFLCIYFGT